MRSLVLALLVALVLLFSSFAGHAPAQSTPRAPAAVPPSAFACSENTILSKEQSRPGNCEKATYAEFGHPLMFNDSPRAAHWGIYYGVSVSPRNSKFVYIWMDNGTDTPQSYRVCCGGMFAAFIELHDHEGKRISMKDPALEKQRVAGGEMAIDCSCSGFVSVPPHAFKIVEGGDLYSVFKLLPGSYTIVERPSNPTNPAAPPASSPTLPESGRHLTISLP